MKPFFSPSASFRNRFSLEYLFEYWKSKLQHPNPVVSAAARSVVDIGEKHPELTRVIEDPSTISSRMDVLAPVFSTLIPTATLETEIAAISSPFEMKPVYATSGFLAMMDVKLRSHMVDVRSSHDILVSTWKFVLAQLFGIGDGLHQSPVFALKDADGLPRFQRVEINLDFCRAVAVGPMPELTPKLKQEILDSANDPGLLAQLIPMDRIELRGIVVLKAGDITSHEIVSRLKFLLIEDNALTQASNYDTIENLIRGALRKKDVSVNIVAFRGEQVLMLQQELMSADDCILQASKMKNKVDYEGTVYGDAYFEDRPIVVSDIQETIADPHMNDLWKLGVRSTLTIPLHAGPAMVGLAVFSSPDPQGLGMGDLETLSDIVPLLALGVRRAVESLERRVQEIIQKNWTSIHPAVAWKFQEAASKSIIEEDKIINPIVFENVSPLYAVSDIRNSSVQRSMAILADLNLQLEMGQEIVDSAFKDRKLPLFEELLFRIGQQKALLTDGLNTGDEISVMNFLRRELEPILEDLKKGSSRTRQAVSRYQGLIHDEARSLYVKRKAFDESVQALNLSISRHLEDAQVEAQAMFPHYFDKTTTDGVDHTIYIGASLVPDGRFDPLYLQNLKLWQFMTMCRIARLTAQLKPQLPVALDMTHLIMVQDLPITIRFNNDEKRFAVDGAYNIRYEIMKKRIDKAVVKGSGERLTQPEKIAIVYSQEEESRDYRRYTSFLIAKGWLDERVEELELEDLQGLHGLKALRVRVEVSEVPEVKMPNLQELADLTLRVRRPASRVRAR